jgi:hypothetical protein
MIGFFAGGHSTVDGILIALDGRVIGGRFCDHFFIDAAKILTLFLTAKQFAQK